MKRLLTLCFCIISLETFAYGLSGLGGMDFEKNISSQKKHLKKSVKKIKSKKKNKTKTYMVAKSK